MSLKSASHSVSILWSNAPKCPAFHKFITDGGGMDSGSLKPVVVVNQESHPILCMGAWRKSITNEIYGLE